LNEYAVSIVDFFFLFPLGCSMLKLLFCSTWNEFDVTSNGFLKCPFHHIFFLVYFNIFMQKELSAELLEIIACPACGGGLIYDKDNSELICRESNLAYAIIDGIPNFLIDEARKLTK